MYAVLSAVVEDRVGLLEDKWRPFIRETRPHKKVLEIHISNFWPSLYVLLQRKICTFSVLKFYLKMQLYLLKYVFKGRVV
jgi:hypothetical protein